MSSWQQNCFRTAAQLAVIYAATFSGSAIGVDQALQAPNVVAISASLVTSGQPSRAALARLAAQGFGAVIYLAPPTVPDAVPGEADIVRKQGLAFVNIPIPFGRPTEADFQSFVEAMNRLHGQKVLVHCQVNMRASSMTFLYRVIVGREKPEQAYESVARVWSPEGPWKKLLIAQLHKAGISFEPY
jgi:protein tyrosine phosphatase (PTP) superfamily phosphohydrolase (DUF442 family)